MKKQILTLGLIAGLGLFTLASCGSDDTTTTTTPETETEEVVESDDVDVVELTIEGNDQMEFNLNQLHAKAGQTVRLTLKHVGELPKESMGHNFVLLKEGVDVQTFANDAAAAKDTDYIPASREGDIIVHTDMIGGGEETTIEFTAPESGKYPFICSYPGHAGKMKGVFIVE